MDNNSKTFMDFIKLEDNLKKLEKRHAIIYLKRISLDLKEKIDKETLLVKIRNYFIKIRERKELNKIINKYKNKYKNLKLEDKEEKIIYNKLLILNDSKIHFEIKRKFYLKSITGEFSVSSHEYLSYTAYMYIEYNDIKTDKYYFKEFENQNEAIRYLKNIEKDYNLKTINDILIKLSNHLSNHMNELNNRIKFFS